MRVSKVALLLCLVLAAGCATRSSEIGRTQWLAPAEVGAVYSGLDLHLQLAQSGQADCGDNRCAGAARDAFARRLAETGGRLAEVAYRRYPELADRRLRFEFVLVPAMQPGILSDSSGSLAVLSGTDAIASDEAALAFLLGREMGHVIARHHDEDSATGLLVSIAAQLLLPVANLIRGGIAIVSSAATTATTALSVAGAQALRAGYRDDQAQEADAIAFELMAGAGWDPIDAAHSLGGQCASDRSDRWGEELAESMRRLDALAVGPRRWSAAQPRALAFDEGGAPD